MNRTVVSVYTYYVEYIDYIYREEYTFLDIYIYNRLFGILNVWNCKLHFIVLFQISRHVVLGIQIEF